MKRQKFSLLKKAAALVLAGTMMATQMSMGAFAVDEQLPEEKEPVACMGISKEYPESYQDWTEAFVGGDGKIGIMVFGNPLDDTIILNDRLFNMAANVNTPERSFDTVDPDTLEQIKQALLKDDFDSANDLANNVSNWKNGGEQNRHPGYEMKVKILGESGEISDYSRTLDFSTGEIAVNWTDDRGEWVRTNFVSRKDNVAVQHLTNPTNADTFDCSLQLTTDPQMNLGAVKISDASTEDYLNIRVIYPNTNDEAGYEGVTRVVTDGQKELQDGVLTITGATYVTTLTRNAKYYTGCRGEDGWSKQQLQSELSKISADYDTLMQGQIETHKAIYDRVTLDLNAPAEDRAKTNEELIAMQEDSHTPVLALYERVFQMGRYAYLSSSSDETPPDLLGIWTGDTNVGWSGYYHLDANLNLQISSGNIGNMPEAMEGYFNIVKSWTEDFKTNAKKLLNCDGVLAGGNTPGLNAGLISDITNRFYPYQYVTGEESWLLYPFWEYYLITGDEEFLKEDLYPTLKEVGYFYESFLTEKDENGDYIFLGSISPESQPSCEVTSGNSLVNNSSFDIAGAELGLRILLETCDILGIEESEVAHISAWQELYDNLPPYLINDDGALSEWSWDSLRNANVYGHRHSSHLVGVWPYNAINKEDTPELYQAATNALLRKDGAGMYEGAGHGILHGALNATKLNQSSSVLRKLQWLLQKNFYYDTSLMTSHFDTSSSDVFCTDVVNTVPGIMMEMILSSSPDYIELLPAVPRELGVGSITGLKAKNQTTINNLEWDLSDDARTVTCTLVSDKDQTLDLIERDGILSATAEGAELGEFEPGAESVPITLKAGQEATITLGLATAKESGENVALNKDVTVSYDEAGHTADMAVDGDLGTRWSNDHEDAATKANGWIQVDLGSIYTVNTVRLSWEAAYAKQYKIQISEDGITWEDAYQTAEGKGNTESIDLEGKRARYIKMQGIEPATEYGYSLYEFEVYGVMCNLALNQPSSASYEEAGYETEFSFDGDVTTRWSNDHEDKATQSSGWLQADLGKSYPIGSVVLNWEAAYARQYKIQVSDDGVEWKDVYVQNSGKGGIETIDLTDVSGQYVRMQGIEPATGYGYSLWEMEVYAGNTGSDEPDPEPTPSDNLALNKPASASDSSAGDRTPDLAVDGDTSTRWSCSQDEDNWFQVDLEDTYSIGEVRLLWEDSYAKQYKIQVSDDGIEWTDVYTETNSDGGEDVINLTDVSGRYVRMQGIQRAGDWGYSLWEFEVYAAEEPEPEPDPNENLALNKPASASDSSASDRLPYLAVDGNTSTRWSCSQDEDNWFQVDLENTYSIGKVRILWEDAYAKQYKIQVSDDGIAWTDVYTETNSDGDEDIINLSDASGRYVRMQGVQRAGEWGYSMWEFEVYSAGETEPTEPANTFNLEFYLGKAQAAIEDGTVATLVESAQNKFNAAVANAEAILADDTATQAEVDAAAKELRTVLNMLSMVAGNKEALIDLIAEAEDLIANADGNYPQSAIDALQDAIDAAKEVVEDGDAFQADVDKAYNDLLDAIEAFNESKLDWRALEAAVADAANIEADKANYVDDAEAWEAFDEAYAAAKEMLESKTAADQAAIDAATTALLEASSNLRYKADKGTLEAVIGDAETVDVTLYTASSVAAFRSALAIANTVLADESLSVDDQAVVDNATVDLEEAMAALVPIDQATADGGDNTTGTTTGSTDTAVAGGGEDTTTTAKTGDMNPLPIVLAVIVLAAGAGYIFRKKEN